MLAALTLLLLSATAHADVPSAGVLRPAFRRRIGRSSDVRDLGCLVVPALRGGGEGSEEFSETSTAAAEEDGAKMTVSFTVECHSTALHESVGIVGGCAELGSWKDISVMNPEEWPKWKLEVPMERYDIVEYKYVKISEHGDVSEWEPAGNR